MSEIAIKLDHIGKRYRIGVQQQTYRTLRDTLVDLTKSPLRQMYHVLKEGRPRKRKQAEHIWAIKDATFQLEKGEILGIVGRNGAGKSTLLKILARIAEPTVGRAEIKGRIASLLEVGTGFHGELTGRENIILNGAILGMKRNEIVKKFDEIVAFSEVDKFIDTPVKFYSSGMYLRLAFAVAAHIEPEILLVDEVLAVGDASFQNKCIGKMSEVAKQGRTVLFVSHNMSAIRSMCTRAIWLDQGRIVKEGVPDDIVNQYLLESNKQTLCCEWTDEANAPQCKHAILKRVAICNENGQLLEQVMTDCPFVVEIDYKVKRSGTTMGLAVEFYDTENNLIMMSLGNREPYWYGKPMDAREYITRCGVPGKLFNNKWIVCAIKIFGKGYTEVYRFSELLKFEIMDGHAGRGDYYGSFPGSIRPDFQWETNLLEDL